MNEPVRECTRLRNGWRAGYIERCMSGSEGGSRKPAVGIQQGGGFLPYKTTTAVSLGAGLALKGRDILLIDLDPQGQCAITLGLSPEPGAFYLLTMGSTPNETAFIRQYVRNTGREHLWLLAGDQTTMAAQTVLNAQEKPISAVRDAVSRFARSGLQYIIFDTAPSVGGIQERAIWAADLVLIPTSTEYLSTDSVRKIVDTLIYLQKEKAW